MLLDLAITLGLYVLGILIFGHFEAHAPRRRRVFKVTFMLVVTALLSATVGRPWSLLWVGSMFTVGLVFHFWWALAHGIHPVTAEPRTKYYALRGWTLPETTAR